MQEQMQKLISEPLVIAALGHPDVHSIYFKGKK